MKFGQGRFESSYDFSWELSTKKHHHAYIGLPQWSVKEWKGLVYSSGTSQKNFLKEYSQYFGCVEVSSTFYADVSKERLLQWKSEVGDEFKFLPKWPKVITHDYLLKDCEKLTNDFIERILTLGDNLGSTILQLPPNFTKAFTKNLYYFFLSLPDDFPISVEFRDKSWFEDHRLYPKLEEYFVENNISTVISDLGGNRDVFHYSFLGENPIVRYLSDEFQGNDEARLGAWKNYLNRVKFFVLHQPDNSLSPHLLKLLDKQKYEEMTSRHQPSQYSLIDDLV